MSVFKGVGVAMITPFDENGINFGELGRMTDRLIAGGADALCVCGTTGEPSTMTKEEKRAAVKFVVERAAGRLPVIAGCGCNNTAETVANAVEAESLGADALLVVTPYYNKCTQGGLVAHYSAVAASVNIPVIVYNVPSRTGVNVLPQTMLELSKVKNIVGIKEASGNADQLQNLCALTAGKTDVYLGEDALTYIGMTLGAKGVISVAANVAPQGMRKITQNVFGGDFDKARQAQFELLPLIRALFNEVNPIPVKKAMELLGFNVGSPRLPLTEAQDDTTRKLTEAMRDLGLLN